MGESVQRLGAAGMGADRVGRDVEHAGMGAGMGVVGRDGGNMKRLAWIGGT